MSGQKLHRAPEGSVTSVLELTFANAGSDLAKLKQSFQQQQDKGWENKLLKNAWRSVLLAQVLNKFLFST